MPAVRFILECFWRSRKVAVVVDQPRCRRNCKNRRVVARIHEELQCYAEIAVADWLLTSLAMHNGPHACDQLHEREVLVSYFGGK